MKYHSTIGKKSLLAMMGFSAGGMETPYGAKSYRDLDEITGSHLSEWKRPLYVRSANKPTVDIDWERMERFDGRKMMQVSFPSYIGKKEYQKMRKKMMEKTTHWIRDNKPGYTLKDRALDIAGRTGTVRTTFLGSWHDPKRKKGPWAGEIFSPEDLVVPRYEGTPEENSRLIRAALRHFGADQVGFVELNDRTRKLIYAFDAQDQKAIEFEDVEIGYETDTKRVLPYKAQWVIVFSIQMSEEQLKINAGSAPMPISSSATGLVYSRAAATIDRLQNFLHVLGYQGLMGTWYNGLGVAPAFGVLAGLGELSRINRLVSPEYGALQRVYKVVTDLPLAPTRPIDAGIMRFCRTCKKCAEACPSKALSMESEPSWEVKGPWNNPGVRTYFDYGPKCLSYWMLSTASCARCLAVCPFSSKDLSLIHQLVKGTLAITPLMNRFLVYMHNIFGYGKGRDPESWWDLDLPPYGIDTSRSANTRTYHMKPRIKP